MELTDWANGNGQTLELDQTEAEGLLDALREAMRSGRGNAILEITEIDVEITG